MRTTLRNLVFALGTAGLAVTACNTKDQTEAVVQARLDAEKVKQLEAENLALKATVDQLKKENEALKLEVASQKALAEKAASEAVAQRQRLAVAGKKPAEKGATRAQSERAADTNKAATGGDSFK